MSEGMQSFQLSGPVGYEKKRELKRKTVEILEELPQVEDSTEEMITRDNETQNKLDELLTIHREAISKKSTWKDKVKEKAIEVVLTLAILFFSYQILDNIKVLDERVYQLGLVVGYDTREGKLVSVEESDGDVLKALNEINEALRALPQNE